MAKDEELVDESTDAGDPKQGAAVDLESELAEQQDRVLRLQAEIQNLRARQARELADVRRYAGIDLIRDILPVLDNIDRAIEATSDSSNVQGLVEGVKLVRQQLVTALAQHNCTEIPAAGEVFNPDLHQAILQQPSADVPAGEVMMVTQAGYQLHDRVVRAAQVIVSAGPDDIGTIAADHSSGNEQVG